MYKIFENQGGWICFSDSTVDGHARLHTQQALALVQRENSNALKQQGVHCLHYRATPSPLSSWTPQEKTRKIQRKCLRLPGDLLGLKPPPQRRALQQFLCHEKVYRSD